jgi:hypothetical protein
MIAALQPGGRHPELVSGPTVKPAGTGRVEGWMLKQVQHDDERQRGGYDFFTAPRSSCFQSGCDNIIFE